MLTQPRALVRVVWKLASRLCSGAGSSQNTKVLNCVVLRGWLLILFLAVCTAAANSRPSHQPDTPTADSHPSAAQPPDDAKQPLTAGSEEAKPSSDKKDAASHYPMPASPQARARARLRRPSSPGKCTWSCATQWTGPIYKGIRRLPFSTK